MCAWNCLSVVAGVDEQVGGSPASLLAEIDGVKPAELTAGLYRDVQRASRPEL